MVSNNMIIIISLISVAIIYCLFARKYKWPWYYYVLISVFIILFGFGFVKGISHFPEILLLFD